MLNAWVLQSLKYERSEPLVVPKLHSHLTLNMCISRKQPRKLNLSLCTPCFCFSLSDCDRPDSTTPIIPQELIVVLTLHQIYKDWYRFDGDRVEWHALEIVEGDNLTVNQSSN
jgi:hypothetical protein